MQGQYPLDFDSLQKGQHLAMEKLEQILALRQKDDPEKFQWALRSLQRDIHEKCELTCCIRADGLDILTDEQAAKYNHRLLQLHLRASFNRHQKNCEVDVTNLPPDRRGEHDLNLLRDGRLLNALRTEQKKIRLEAVGGKWLKGRKGKAIQPSENAPALPKAVN